MQFKFNDGGRSLLGYKGKSGDCVCRAIAICTNKPYQEIYDRLAIGNVTQRKSKLDKKKRGQSANNGICVGRDWFKNYMAELGFKWVATMKIGQGCKVHLKGNELPMGRIICSVSKHYVAVIDRVINDTHDPSKDGTRCVYGYWELKLN